MSDERDEGLQSFEEAAREELDARMLDAPERDFLDVVGRVRDLTLEATDDQLLAEYRGLDIEADDVPPLSTADANALEAINADVRQILDATFDNRRLSAIPAAPLPKKRFGWGWAAAAAIVLFAGAAGATLASSYLSATNSGEAVVNQAADQRVTEPNAKVAPSMPAPSAPAVVIPREPEQLAPQAEEPVPEPTPPEPSGADHPAPEQRLEALDAEAYALFRAGNLRGAQKKFERITKIGGRSQYAEIAYGELFAIARQLDGPVKQDKLWRSYLRRFPRGRYADGARAGLCRRAEGQARHKCWTRYLQKHPKGAARGEALRETAELP